MVAAGKNLLWQLITVSDLRCGRSGVDDDEAVQMVLAQRAARRSRFARQV